MIFATHSFFNIHCPCAVVTLHHLYVTYIMSQMEVCSVVSQEECVVNCIFVDEVWDVKNLTIETSVPMNMHATSI